VSRDPVPLSDSLTGVVRSLRGPEPSSASTGAQSATTARDLGGVFGRWDEAVGPAVARHVQPVKLDGERLVVEVDDPAWATQLRFLERAVIDRLAQVTGATIASFEIRVGRPR
jgi:predicted nucleic acid-binding Zn ribbon protein